MSNQTKYSKTIISQSLELYKSGLTAKEVEEKTGMKEASVCYYARKKGISRSNHLSKKKIDEILKFYAAKLSSTEVSELTGVSEKCVQRHARKAGIIRKRNYFKLSKKKKEEIEYYYTSLKYSRRQVSKITGVDQFVINRYLDKKGLLRNRIEAIKLRMRRRKKVRDAHNRQREHARKQSLRKEAEARA